MSYSDIARWQAKIRELKALISQLRGIISSCGSLGSSLQQIKNCTKEVIVNGEEYDKGKLESAMKVLDSTKSECSTIISACNSKIAELERMIEVERRRLEAEARRRREAEARRRREAKA